MSPILVRPVREQLEHDRIIRLLQSKLRRRYEAAVNPGSEQNAGVGSEPGTLYPDVVLSSLERGRRLQAVIEVETGESVNHLEALAEWASLSRLRAEFHLYVPAGMVDVARRLCEDKHIRVNEIWSYHAIGDQVRFTMIHRDREGPSPARPRPEARAGAASGRRSGARTAKAPARGRKAGRKPVRAQKRR